MRVEDRGDLADDLLLGQPRHLGHQLVVGQAPLGAQRVEGHQVLDGDAWDVHVVYSFVMCVFSAHVLVSPLV